LSYYFIYYRQGKKEPEAHPTLDYTRVKKDLAEAEDRRKALLVQALRWVRSHVYV